MTFVPSGRSMATLIAALILACACACTSTAHAQEDVLSAFEWERLADLPRPLSGQAAGVSHGAVIVAGGTDFPVPLFQGGTKTWYDAVHVLAPGASSWTTPYHLRRPRAYAAHGTIGDLLVVAGGSDSTTHHSDAFAFEWVGGRLSERPLPHLPVPIAMAGSAVSGHTLFVVGGQSNPADAEALRSVWTIDLSAPTPRWTAIEPLPGEGRILPATAVVASRLYVFSGASLQRGPDGAVARRYLADGYAWSPQAGWSRVADVPRPIVAAPIAAVGQSDLVAFGGDSGADAARVQELKDRHPGFSRDILAYHTVTNTWRTLGQLPEGFVTTSAIALNGDVVIPGGEDRPGHRSSAVLRGRLVPPRGGFSGLDYAVLVAYFVPLLLIGRHFSHRASSTEEFFLGGRRVPWWAAGLSIYGTQLSAITFLAIPAKAYAEDWVFFIANACIILVAPIVVFFYLPFLRGLGLTSAYEYLERRFNVVVRLSGSMAFVLLQVARMAIVLFLPALMLSAVTGLDVYASILLMGVLCTVYTLEGGMHAVIWTDVMQVVVLLGAALVSLAIIVANVDGGVPGIWHAAHDAGKLHMFNWTWSATTTSVWVVVLGNVFANMVPYTADQAVVQRYLTTSDERQAARAVWSGALLTLPTSVLFFGVGTALYAFYRAHPGALDPSVAVDATFAWFIGNQLPAGVSGLAVAGVFAAAMSTLSGSINSIATVVVVDGYARFARAPSDASQMRLAKWLTGAIGALGTGTALVLATWEVASLWDTFLRALGLFGGGLAGVFALGIFTTRASASGALAGLLASAGVLFAVQQYTAIHFFLYAAIGIAVCVIVGYLASLVFGRESRPLQGLTVHTRGVAIPAASALQSGDVS